MKTNSQPKKICSRPTLSRLRIVAAGILVVAAAALAATALQPPKLPWGVPTVTVGPNPVFVAVDAATDTIYVTNIDNTISVIDGSRCNEDNASRCSPVATLTNVGPAPAWITFDQTTGTLYVANGLTTTGDDGNTIAVVNGRTCNAKNSSGCGQPPLATVTVPGVLASQQTGNVSDLTLDTSNHTLYVGDANEGPVVMLNTATCNARHTTGCNQTRATMANGDGVAIDYSNHSVYVTDILDQLVSVFNGPTCNATTQSDCSEFPVVTSLSAGFGAVDQTTHTLYVPVAGEPVSYAAVIDGSACNGTVHSGCGQTPHLVQVGSLGIQLSLDPTTRTVYVLNQESSSISVINAATCNGTTQSGCPNKAPALAVGIFPGAFDIDPNTHALYVSSQDTNTVWVLDASKCDGTHTSGCTRFAPTTTVGAGPVQVAENPNTKTLYETNQVDNTVSVIDTTVCSQHNLGGCTQTWPTIPVGATSRHIGINKITNTVYVSNRDDGTLSIINGGTCNRSDTSTCSQAQPTTTVGDTPQQIAVDESTNTIYVVNQGDGSVSVVSGSHCRGMDTTGCKQSWPTIPVGNSPQALDFNPINHTLYVTNTDDNTVSVISTHRCNSSDISGCAPLATFPVGAAPRAIGIVLDKDTVFVGNRDDLTVSVIDGSTCNGSNTTGCPQSPPPAVVVGAFPDTGGIGSNILGRSIAVDQHKHIVYIPVIGDSDVAMLDANACRAGHVNECHAKIVRERMGGFAVMATVDESTETVCVANDTDGTVSLFPSHH